MGPVRRTTVYLRDKQSAYDLTVALLEAWPLPCACGNLFTPGIAFCYWLVCHQLKEAVPEVSI